MGLVSWPVGGRVCLSQEPTRSWHRGPRWPPWPQRFTFPPDVLGPWTSERSLKLQPGAGPREPCSYKGPVGTATAAEPGTSATELLRRVRRSRRLTPRSQRLTPRSSPNASLLAPPGGVRRSRRLTPRSQRLTPGSSWRSETLPTSHSSLLLEE
ncbi:unnamed protein product [Arctogadus glacialis]